MAVQKLSASPDLEIGEICCDSRQACPGSLFVAICGEKEDGHGYVAQAAAAGACCVLCQQEPREPIPYVLVENSRRALAQVSTAFYGEPARELTLIGVTGTNGKTTCTYLVKQLLELTEGAKVGLIGTNGNWIGQRELPARRTTPESLEIQALLRQMVREGCRYAVMEVSSHALEQERVWGLPFRVAAFTNLTQDHLDYHQTMEAYAAAKAKLFTQCDLAVYNKDDAWGERMVAQSAARRFSFGQQLDCDLVGWHPRYESDRVCFTAVSDQEEAPACVHIPGEFSLYNALTALTILRALGKPLHETAAALERCRGVRGRIEVASRGKPYTVLIDYAHTPDGLENVLRAIRGFAENRIITVFGCGGDRDRGKRPKMARTAEVWSDELIVTSDNPRTESPYRILLDVLAGLEGTKPFSVLENREEAIALALRRAGRGDVVLLAGKGHETYQIRGTESIHLDEREILQKLWRESPAD